MCMLHVTPITPLTFLTKKNMVKNVNIKVTYLHIFLCLMLMFPGKFLCLMLMFPGKFLCLMLMFPGKFLDRHVWCGILRSDVVKRDYVQRIQTFYGITPCQSVRICPHFGGIRCLHHQGKVLAVTPCVLKIEAAKPPWKVCKYFPIDAASYSIRAGYSSTHWWEPLSSC